MIYNGNVTTVAGQNSVTSTIDNSNGLSAGFGNILGMYLDIPSGILYIAQQASPPSVRTFQISTGAVSTIPATTLPGLISPVDVTYDSSSQTIFVSDPGSQDSILLQSNNSSFIFFLYKSIWNFKSWTNYLCWR